MLCSARFCLTPVVAAEKAHQNLLDGVEHFDKSQMKHTTTEEKNSLPPIEGFFAAFFNACIFIFKLLDFFLQMLIILEAISSLPAYLTAT